MHLSGAARSRRDLSVRSQPGEPPGAAGSRQEPPGKLGSSPRSRRELSGAARRRRELSGAASSRRELSGAVRGERSGAGGSRQEPLGDVRSSCHALAMLLPCSCHVLAMLLPCSCHALAILLPCSCMTINALVLPLATNRMSLQKHATAREWRPNEDPSCNRRCVAIKIKTRISKRGPTINEWRPKL